MGGLNYAFLNELMQDPTIAAMMRSGEAQPQQSPQPAEPPVDIAQPNIGPPPSADSPLGKIIDAPPNPPASLEFNGPGGVQMTGANNPANHIPDMMQRPKLGWRNVVNRLVTAGLAAGTTPSKYGGGAMDIMNGMQAGMEDSEKRDMMSYQLRRQMGLDDLTRRDKESEIGSRNSLSKAHEAQAEYYKAQAAQKAEINPQHDIYAQWSKETDPKKKEALWEMYLQSMGHQPRQTFPYRRLGNGMAIDANGNIVQVDPEEAMHARDEIVRKRLGIDPMLWPYRQKGIFEQRPDLEQFIYRGPEGMKPQTERNPTEASLAERAASGDALARRAFDMLNKAKPVDPIMQALREQQLAQKRSDQFRKIEDEKTTLLSQANHFEEQGTRLLKDQTDPTKQAPANDPRAIKVRQEARAMRQQAYDSYTSAIQRATGDPKSAEKYIVLEDGRVVPQSALDAAGVKIGRDGKALAPKAAEFLNQYPQVGH